MSLLSAAKTAAVFVRIETAIVTAADYTLQGDRRVFRARERSGLCAIGCNGGRREDVPTGWGADLMIALVDTLHYSAVVFVE